MIGDRFACIVAVGLSIMLSAERASAAPPPRSPDERQALVDLAYGLGEMHALTLVCAARDHGWRGRMNRLIQVEAPDEAWRRRLVDSFNAGFATRQAEFPVCRPDAARARQTTAARGRELSERLANPP